MKSLLQILVDGLLQFAQRQTNEHLHIAHQASPLFVAVACEQLDTLHEAALGGQVRRGRFSVCSVHIKIFVLLLFTNGNEPVQDGAQRDRRMADDLFAQHVDADQLGQVEAGHVEYDELNDILVRVRGGELVALFHEKRAGAFLAVYWRRLVGGSVESDLNQWHQFVFVEQLVQRQVVDVEREDAKRELHDAALHFLAQSRVRGPGKLGGQSKVGDSKVQVACLGS